MKEENFLLSTVMGVVYKSQMRTLLYSYNYLLPLWQCCYERCSSKLITDDLWLCLRLIFVVMEIKKHSRIMLKLKMCMAYLEGEALKMATTFESETVFLQNPFHVSALNTHETVVAEECWPQ